MDVLPYMKSLQALSIGGCSAVAFADAQKHLSGSRSGFASGLRIGQAEGLRGSFGIFSCPTRKVHDHKKSA